MCCEETDRFGGWFTDLNITASKKSRQYHSTGALGETNGAKFPHSHNPQVRCKQPPVLEELRAILRVFKFQSKIKGLNLH